MPIASIEEIQSKLGTEVGISDWILIDQGRIDAFADVTEDPQFIHVDPEAAAKTPFGGTVAHGFLTLSLLSRMAADAMLRPEGVKMGVNYGFERVRFMAPVRSGKRVRGRFTLVRFEEKKPGQWQFVHNVTVEIEGEEKPALVADWILVDQGRIDTFAEVTEDRQFIHVDPEAAAKTPFGGTVAHGFLTLSLLSRMAEQAMLRPENIKMGVNSGFEKVRFLAPVRSGSKVRGRFRLKQFEEKRPGQWQFMHEVTVEIEGEDKPALIAEWIGLLFL